MFQRINAVILVLLSTITIYCQSENCDVINTSFQDGEELTFKVFYNWFVVFADVGEATMKVEKDNIYNKEAYHFYADGKSNSWWDNFFEVRDRYEAWVDPHTLRPYLFQRNIKEGTFKQHVSYVFNPEDTTAYSKYKVNNDKLKQDTLKITPCTYDVMSSLL
ncbi:MAG: DUF3108 domain-containing protein, partial [Bacteroidales bacterium]|nr:DUF3108 domain-containing protein [Bacteroidales bacterium]